MEKVKELLLESLTENLYQIVVSGARGKEGTQKLKVRPIMLQGQLVFQVSRFVGKQVMHENLSAQEAVERLIEEMENHFKQLEAETKEFTAVVLVSVTAGIRLSI